MRAWWHQCAKLRAIGIMTVICHQSCFIEDGCNLFLLYRFSYFILFILFLFLYIFSETFLIIREIERDKIMCIGFHVKYLLFLSDFNET